jgi:iron complex outermembrane recepter protein
MNYHKILKGITNKKIFVITLLTLIQQTIIAQTITGKVLFKTKPISGVNISEKGTTNTVTTSNDGSFSISVSTIPTTLVVSSVGYLKTEVAVSDASSALNINLDASTEQVIVVGSRSRVPRSSIQTAVPVDALSAKDLTVTGQLEPTQMINFVAPSFNSARQTITDGTDHIDPATLRGLGPDQVLVLVNGKRRHSTALVNVNGSVGRGSVGTDLNAIPPVLLKELKC